MSPLNEHQDIDKIIQSKQEGFKNKIFYEQSKNLWDSTKRSNICVFGVSKGEQNHTDFHVHQKEKNLLLQVLFLINNNTLSKRVKEHDGYNFQMVNKNTYIDRMDRQNDIAKYIQLVNLDKRSKTILCIIFVTFLKV